MRDIIICNVIFIRAINQKEKERKEAKEKEKYKEKYYIEKRKKLQIDRNKHS